MNPSQLHKEDKYNFRFNERRLRFAGIPLLALIITMVMGKTQNCFSSFFWVDYLITFVFTFCIWNANVIIMQYLKKQLPELSQTKKRIVKEIVFTACSTILISFIIDTILFLLFSKPESATEQHEGYVIALMANAFVLSVYEGIYFFEKYRDALIATEELKKSNLQSQFDSLKNQVNPHFLFNSLNTLSSLIEENKEKSIAFVHQMANVYRYLLQSTDNKLTPLARELEFIGAYFFMLKTRFEDNLEVTVNVDEKYFDYNVPPLTLQMLVENAVKHNVISSNKPLHIKIFIEGDSRLVVENNLQKRTQLVRSNGVGLKNILQRYELMGYTSIDVLQDENIFAVKVPLIKPTADN